MNGALAKGVRFRVERIMRAVRHKANVRTDVSRNKAGRELRAAVEELADEWATAIAERDEARASRNAWRAAYEDQPRNGDSR